MASIEMLSSIWHNQSNNVFKSWVTQDLPLQNPNCSSDKRLFYIKWLKSLSLIKPSYNLQTIEVKLTGL